MLRIHIANASSRDATVVSTRARPPASPALGKNGETVTFRRYVAAGAARLHEDLVVRLGDGYSQALINEDPEIDFDSVGRYVEGTQSVLLGSTGEPLYCAPQVWEITYAPDGSETDRRAPIDVAPTINDAIPLSWTGRKMSKADMIHRFAIRRTLQLQHIDGVTYDFLHAMAMELSADSSVVLLGSGADGKGPLVLQLNGVPYRGFLEGRVDGERYQLFLHLSNMELKRPVARVESGEGDA
jgi:hypothetical protein